MPVYIQRIKLTSNHDCRLYEEKKMRRLKICWNIHFNKFIKIDEKCNDPSDSNHIIFESQKFFLQNFRATLWN